MDILIEMTKFNNFFDHSRSIYNNVKKLKNFGEKNSLKKSKNKKKIWGGDLKKNKIINFVLPQKYVKKTLCSGKLWILRPFFKIFLLCKQFLVKNNKDFLK